MKIEDEVTDVICEECGRNMVIKYGPHGKFLACPGFPECRNTKPYLEKIGVKCPHVRQGRGASKNQEGKEVLWLRGQSGLRVHVLAEAFRRSRVRRCGCLHGGKGK